MNAAMNEALEQEFDFYRGAGRGDVLDQLAHLAAWARSLVMLTGPLGAGKTVLLEEVVARVGESGRTIVVRPPVGFLSTGHELLRHVVADLGEKVTDGLDDAALRRLVMQHIVAELANDRSTLLLLDDAHELSADVLRTVAALVDEAKESRALNVLLAGEPSLHEQLRKATPARDNWHEIRLRPFALNDVRVFLRQRLPQSAASLDAAGMQALARKSGGWPGRILGAFDGQPRRRARLTRRIPLLHVASLFALMTALGVMLWLQQQPDDPEPAVASTTTVETLALPGTGAGTGTREVEAANGSGVRVPLPADGTRPAPVDPRSLLPPSQRIPVPTPPPELTMPAPPPPPVIKVPGAQTEPPPAPVATALPANAPAAAAPATPPRIALPKPEPSPPEAVAQRPPAQAAPAPPRAAGGDNGWLKEQPPAHFTVQIMGVSAASAAQSYVRRNPNAGLRIVRTLRNGRDWYVVVKGSYRARSEAQAAMGELGDSGAQPWVRTFDGIQREAPGN
jgi:DamX protein